MPTQALIADIGGTNARFALVDDRQIIAQQTLAVSDFEQIDQAIDYFLESHRLRQPKVFAFAFACPVYDQVIKLTNSHWVIEKSALQKHYGLDRFLAINDFAALAHAVPLLGRESLIQIGGSADATGNLAVLGPGTGLGVSGVIYQSDNYHNWTVIEGEGGHASFAPCTELEIRIHRRILEKHPRISTERLLQGKGLLLLYQCLCQLDGTEPKWIRPEDVSKAAIAGVCRNSTEALEVYCNMLGSFAGDLTLTLGARGGAYIGGGIVGNFTDFLIASDFRQRFEAKGRLAGYMAEIPIYLITAEVPAFDGIMRALDHDTASSTG